MNKAFTGNKDVDLITLSKLNDRDLFKICLEVNNKYLNYICNDEHFWKKRANKNMPDLIKYRKENQRWKKFYVQMIKYKELLNELFTKTLFF
jgi:histidinol phosphatase-like PHP family hydrolase